MTHVLAGANVAQSEKTLHLVPPGKGLELVWPGRVEAFSQHAEPNGVYWICHGLVEAIHVAYGGHFALALSPDMLWLPIVQGLATIVDEAPETYRTLFVSHEGQIELRVSRDGFVLGSPANDWPGATPSSRSRSGTTWASPITSVWWRRSRPRDCTSVRPTRSRSWTSCSTTSASR